MYPTIRGLGRSSVSPVKRSNSLIPQFNLSRVTETVDQVQLSLVVGGSLSQYVPDVLVLHHV